MCIRDRNYAGYFARKLDRCLLDASRQPLARIAAFVEEAKAGMQRFEYRRGCLVGNLGPVSYTHLDVYKRQFQ